MNKTLTKILTTFFFLAIQGCIVEVSPHPPRPTPDIHCYDNWNCPVGTYCEHDGYCYEHANYVECYSYHDCPIYSYCGPNGLCYESY